MSKTKIANKKLIRTLKATDRHWVGNGFHVHGLLRPTPELTSFISPFILMDYAPPKQFPRSDSKKGVGAHPHRGFETVTFAYQGEIEHRDSAGGGGKIGEGDVQWMTAGSGIVHEEFHSKSFASTGGVFEMVQLWVNLPKKSKMTKPKYQEIKASHIPSVTVGEGLNLRVIAGEFQGATGPAETFTDMNIYDISSTARRSVEIEFKENTNTVLLVLDGALELEGKEYQKQNVLIFERKGGQLSFTVSPGFKGLVLNGDPIEEPVVAHGPFVMNTEKEIVEAFKDYQEGKMGSF